MVIVNLINVDEYIAKNHSLLSSMGFSQKEVSSLLGLSQSFLSRKIRRLNEYGYVLEYYNVFLDKLVYPTWIYFIESTQRMPLSKCFIDKNFYAPDLLFFSPINRSTYIAYYISRKHKDSEESSGPLKLDSIDYTKCRIHYDYVKETIIPIEDFVDEKIYILNGIRSSNFNVTVDVYDDYIARLFFILTNPPIKYYGLMKLVKRMTINTFALDVFKNHYYSHVREKIVFKRYLYRKKPREYVILRIISTSFNLVEELLNEMFANQLIIGIDQIFVLSYQPVSLVIHCWVDPEKIWDDSIVLEEFSNTYYYIYLVRRIL